MDREDSELRGSEWEDDSGDQDEDNTGFFYEDDKEEVQEEEEIGIGARVAARRQGLSIMEGGRLPCLSRSICTVRMKRSRSL